MLFRSKNDLVQHAFPLCPFYVPAAQKVNARQKSLQVSPQALLHATTTKRGLRMSERDVLFPVLCGFGPKMHLHFFSGSSTTNRHRTVISTKILFHELQRWNLYESSLPKSVRLLAQNYNKSVDSPEILQSLPKILLIFL